MSNHFSNFNTALFVTFIVLIIDFIAQVATKNNSYAFGLIRNLFKYNFIIRLLLETSLQFMLFSLVNMTASPPSNSSEYFSLIFSFIFVIGLVGSSLAVGIVLLFDLARPQDSIQCLTFFQDLRLNQKPALLYYSIFILRRFLMTLAVVFFQNHQVFQIFALVMCTLGMLIYLAYFKPFIQTRNNFLEFFNESIVMVSLYHLIFFSDMIYDFRMKYTIGWSLNLLIVFQFMVNVTVIVVSSVQGMRMQFKKLRYKCQKWKKAYNKWMYTPVAQKFNETAQSLNSTNGALVLNQSSPSNIRFNTEYSPQKKPSKFTNSNMNPKSSVTARKPNNFFMNIMNQEAEAGPYSSQPKNKFQALKVFQQAMQLPKGKHKAYTNVDIQDVTSPTKPRKQQMRQELETEGDSVMKIEEFMPYAFEGKDTAVNFNPDIQ